MVGLALIILTGLMELGFMIYASIFPPDDPYAPDPHLGYQSPSGDEPSVLLPLLTIVSTTFIPALLLLMGHSEGSKALRLVAKVWLILAGLFLTGLGFLSLKDPPFEPLLFMLGFFTLLGTVLLGSEVRAAGARP